MILSQTKFVQLSGFSILNFLKLYRKSEISVIILKSSLILVVNVTIYTLLYKIGLILFFHSWK